MRRPLPREWLTTEDDRNFNQLTDQCRRRIDPRTFAASRVSEGDRAAEQSVLARCARPCGRPSRPFLGHRAVGHVAGCDPPSVMLCPAASSRSVVRMPSTASLGAPVFKESFCPHEEIDEVVGDRGLSVGRRPRSGDSGAHRRGPVPPASPWYGPIHSDRVGAQIGQASGRCGGRGR